MYRWPRRQQQQDDTSCRAAFQSSDTLPENRKRYQTQLCDIDIWHYRRHRNLSVTASPYRGMPQGRVTSSSGHITYRHEKISGPAVRHRSILWGKYHS